MRAYIDVLRRKCWWVCVGVVLGGSSCVPPETEGLYGDQVLSPEDETPEPEPEDGMVEGVADFANMTGVWVQARDLSTCVTLGQINETRSYHLVRVEIEQDGIFLRETHEVCSVGASPTLGLETVIPTVILEQSNPLRSTSVLLGTEPGDKYIAGPIVSTWGLQLEDPVRAVLPTTEDLPDERIFDADQDENPGVTLKVGNGACDLYVAQRDVTYLEGTLLDNGTIEGTTTAKVEQVVLGSTNDFCAQGAGLATRSRPEHSFMRMVRADAPGLLLDEDEDEEVTCEEILAARPRIIAWMEADNTRCQQDTMP